MLTRQLGRTLLGLMLILGAAAAFAQAAAAATCGSNWCSGSDSNTSANIQGNGPQVYIGEVDSYQDDFYGSSGVAWSNTGANNAKTRYQNSSGIGVEDYYFGGGSGANNQGVTAYCFGAKQGFNETYHMYVTYNAWVGYQYMSFLDIEDPISNYGWYSTQQSANRSVFNGWYDYIVGSNPCGYGSNANDKSQPGVYSDPNAWNNAIGTGIPNTYVWTYQNGCYGSWPGANWGGRAQWFGGSSYNWALQYDQQATSCGTQDYNDAYEPD